MTTSHLSTTIYRNLKAHHYQKAGHDLINYVSCTSVRVVCVYMTEHTLNARVHEFSLIMSFLSSMFGDGLTMREGG